MANLDLDDEKAVTRLDSGGVLRQLREFPEQCVRGWHAGVGVSFPERYRRPGAVVVAAIGGSAMGPDLVRAAVSGLCRAPIIVNRRSTLPAFVSSETLVVCSSYSGGTEETLAAFDDAQRRGARIVLMGGGGKLFEIGAALPQCRIHAKGMPRAAMGESALAFAGLLHRLDLAPGLDSQVEGLEAVLRETARSLDVGVPEARNPAKLLARAVAGRIPVIVGAGHLGPVARRWKGQFNENADQWAVWDELPEFDHNTIQGLRLPAQAGSGLHVIFLHAASEGPESPSPSHHSARLLEAAGVPVSLVRVRGEGPLAQALAAVVWGDFVSLYIAALNGVDPTPIENIVELKRLKSGRS